MKRGFLLRDTKLPPRHSLPTCRLATEPPARMLATERHPKWQSTTEKFPAELLATKHPGVVAHDVLCSTHAHAPVDKECFQDCATKIAQQRLHGNFVWGPRAGIIRISCAAYNQVYFYKL